MQMEEEAKLQQLSRNATTARASITQELGITAGATVDSVRFILEEILSYRLDTMRKNLLEQNQNNQYFRKELQQNINFMTKQMDLIREDNDKLKQQIIDRSIQNTQENNSNSKLNTITLQNMKTLALLKKIHQYQMDNDTDNGIDYKSEHNDIQNNGDRDGHHHHGDTLNDNNNNNNMTIKHHRNDSNLLKKLKLENTELKAQLKQSQQHIKYLEESKINTIMKMSTEIQRLRQQIIYMSPNNKDRSSTNR